MTEKATVDLAGAKAPVKQEEFKVAQEVAEMWFEKWCEAMDIDLENSARDEETRGDIAYSKDTIIKGIRKGRVTFNEDDEIQYVPYRKNTKCRGDLITFRERTGGTLMAADTKKTGKDHAKMYAMIAEITGRVVRDFHDMAGADIKMCEMIFSLLVD